MKQEPEGLSRRELFGRLFAPFRGAQDGAAAPASPEPRVKPSPAGVSQVPWPEPAQESPSQASVPAAEARVAVIAGRHCVAYEGIPCNACLDHCPEPGAIVMGDGVPRIELALCTGCTLCEPVCPAPVKAIQFIPRPGHLPPVKRP